MWHSGRAPRDGADYGGWLVGHFRPPAKGPRSTRDLEVKWFEHPAGDRRAAPVTAETRTTLVLLVDGRFRLRLGADEVVLAERGDYAVWGPGVGHTWEAEERSTVITVRWPSRD
jgi:hypothetical protein